MDILLIGLAALVFYNLKIIPNGINEDFMSKESTNAVNGIFVVLVFMCHFVFYISPGDYDSVYYFLNRNINSLIVVPFLFYSGYGIMCSIKSKGVSYVKSMPLKRILRVWYHFAFSVLLFAAVKVILNIPFTTKSLLLSLIGIKHLGNSNWYVVATLLLYIFTFISFLVFRKKLIFGVIAVFLMTVGYIAVCSYLNVAFAWYKTVVAYSVGMLFALYKDKIITLFKNRTALHIFSLIVFAAGIVLFIKMFNKNRFVMYNIQSVLFIAFLVLATMKVKLGNKVLSFLGKYTFEIYILQKIPMILLKNTIHREYYYLLVCIIITLIMAVLFRKVTDFFDKRIFRLTT